MDKYTSYFIIAALCLVFIIGPFIRSSMRLSHLENMWNKLVTKKGLLPCDVETENIISVINRFYSPEDKHDDMAVLQPYKFGKLYLYKKVRHLGHSDVTDWGEILFPLKRKSTAPFIIVFSTWLLTDKFRRASGQREPGELCGSLNVALDIPAEWDKKNVRAVFGREGRTLDGELLQSQLDIVLKTRRFGASAFQMIDDYGMLSFDPSCYALNIEKLWECAKELSN